jgi:hypothetical protein
MTPAEAHKAIYARWLATWHTLVGGTQAAPTVPYAIDNRRLTQPAATFVTVSITNLTADQATMGREGFRRFERPGWIDVKLYGASGQGRGALDTLAQYVKEIYEARRLGSTPTEHGVVTLSTSVSEVRNDREFPDLWCLLCRVPFWYHERR